MKKLLFLHLLLCNILFDACDKNQSCQNALAAPVITSNAPVTAGDALVLSIPYIVNGSYNWLSKYKNFSDSNVLQLCAFDTYLSGQYSVQYFTQNCVSDLATSDVVINPVTSPCSYQTNHGKATPYRPSMTFINLYLDISSDSTYYTLEADGGTSDDYISLKFGGYTKPQNGVYTVVYYDYPNPGEVHFFLALGDQPWDVNSGKVYVNTVGGKLAATWCDLDCHDHFLGTAGTTSGNLTEP